MNTMVNVADLKDPNDSQGRTYRQVNNAKTHKFGIGVLVELNNGVRLFTAKQTRDCDGTPLYSLTPESKKSPDNPLNEIYWVHGYDEDGMREVNVRTEKQMTKSAFKELIKQDIEWLRKQPDTLESTHINCILDDAVNKYYC